MIQSALHCRMTLGFLSDNIIRKYTKEKERFCRANFYKKTDAVVAVCVNFSGLVPEWEEIAAVAMGVQNMYLTCTANNVGCYWSTPNTKDYIGDYLGLEENQKCLGFFYMGMV